MENPRIANKRMAPEFGLAYLHGDIRGIRNSFIRINLIAVRQVSLFVDPSNSLI